MLRAPRRLDRLAEFFCRHNAKCLQNSVCFVLVVSGTPDSKLCLAGSQDSVRITVKQWPGTCQGRTVPPRQFLPLQRHSINTTSFESDQLHDVPNFDQNNLTTQSACQSSTPPSDSIRPSQPQITTGPKRKSSSELLDALLRQKRTANATSRPRRVFWKWK